MTARRWRSGWIARVGGLNFRVVPGKKSPDDLRMEWRVGGEWQAVPMAAAAVLTDFFYENEDVLYPPPSYQGGGYFMAYLNTAVGEGWEAADVRLRGERRQKESRQEITVTVPTNATSTSTTNWDVSEVDAIIDAALRRDAA